MWAPSPAKPCRSQPGRGTWSQGLPKPLAGWGTRGELGTQQGAGGQVPAGLHGHKEPLVGCGTRGWLGAIGHPLATGQSRLLLAAVSALPFAAFFCCCCELKIILAGQGGLVPKSLCCDQDFMGFISSGERGEARTRPGGVVSVCGVVAAGAL